MSNTMFQRLIPLKPLLLFPMLLLLAGCASARAADEPTRFTGFLENETLVISPEIGGRIIAMPITQGQTVHTGDLIAQLDDTYLQLQLAQADAAVQKAQAQLAQLQAAVRPEEVALAQARVAQAQAGLQAAEIALQDAMALRDNPQDLDLQIAQARTTLAEAQAAAQAAQYQAQAADLEKQMWGAIAQDLARGVTVTLPDGTVITVDSPPEKKHQANVQWNLASQKAWQAWAQAKQAQQAVEQAQVALDNLLLQRKDNQQAQAQVVAATNARDQAAAAVAQAQAALDATQAGPTPSQLQAAQAAVQQAQAARDAQAVALNKTRITAPADGIIQEQYLHPGEVVGPNQQLVRLVKPNQFTITIYVPAGIIDNFQVNTILPLVVDTAPDHPYQARVTAISDEPEYTMRQSQNVGERAAVLYGVTLKVLNPDPFLRPGLPADILLTQP